MKFSCASFTHTTIKKNIVVLETNGALTFLFQTVSKANLGLGVFDEACGTCFWGMFHDERKCSLTICCMLLRFYSCSLEVSICNFLLNCELAELLGETFQNPSVSWQVGDEDAGMSCLQGRYLFGPITSFSTSQTMGRMTTHLFVFYLST